jgi:hypothetical protein
MDRVELRREGLNWFRASAYGGWRRSLKKCGCNHKTQVPQVSPCQVQRHPLQFVSGHRLQIEGAAVVTGLQTETREVTIGPAGEAEAGSAGEQPAEE